MKKYRTMIIMLAICVVLIVAYFIMAAVNEKQKEQQAEEPIMVTDEENLVSMEYTDGETTMSYVKEDDEWSLADDEETVLDSEAVESIASTLSKVASIRLTAR